MRQKQWHVRVDGQDHGSMVNRQYAEGYAKIQRRKMREAGEKWQGRVKVEGH